MSCRGGLHLGKGCMCPPGMVQGFIQRNTLWRGWEPPVESSRHKCDLKITATEPGQYSQSPAQGISVA